MEYELTKKERNTLDEITHSFLDHCSWGDEDREEAYALLMKLRNARFVTVTVPD